MTEIIFVDLVDESESDGDEVVDLVSDDDDVTHEAREDQGTLSPAVAHEMREEEGTLASRVAYDTREE